ncbi:MAG: hypothetical protein AABX89_06365 [Candidatus Thermoplasmatota archaeon]
MPSLPRNAARASAPAPRTPSRTNVGWTAIPIRPTQPALKLASPARPAHARPARSGLLAWIRVHKVASAVGATLLLLSGLVTAALLIRQDIATAPSTTAPDVKFLSGTSYASINAAGFATLTLGSSGASANLALSGVSGAALVTLGDVMKLQNTDATQAYTVTLARSAALNAAITGFTVTIKDGATTLLTWDAASAATSSSFNLAVSKTLDISVALVVTDGTAAGALGSFGMQFSLAPV